MSLIRPRQALILLVPLALTLLLILVQPEHEPVLRSLAPSPVLVTPARQADLHPVVRVSGHLQPARRAWLRFEVEGRVAERHVEPGQVLEAGDVLLVLDDRDYRDAVIQARAELEQAQQDLERDRKLLKLAERSRKLQEEEVARLKRLGERSMASKTRLGDSSALLAQRLSEEARLRSSVAAGPQRVASRRAQLDRAQRNLERCVLRAPFAGRVNQVLLEVGDYAARNQKAAQLISEQLDFAAQVRGEVARALSLGQQVTVTVEGRQYQATVTAVQPDPDPKTFTHAIRLRLPASVTRPGAVALAELPLPALQQALVVPVTAVLLDEGGAFVFRVRDGQLQRLPVQLGARVEQQQVILAGLEPGTEVVVRDVAALADGQAVVAETVQPGSEP